MQPHLLPCSFHSSNAYLSAHAVHSLLQSSRAARVVSPAVIPPMPIQAHPRTANNRMLAARLDNYVPAQGAVSENEIMGATQLLNSLKWTADGLIVASAQASGSAEYFGSQLWQLAHQVLTEYLGQLPTCFKLTALSIRRTLILVRYLCKRLRTEMQSLRRCRRGRFLQVIKTLMLRSRKLCR